MGRDFLGTYDLRLHDALLLFARGVHDRAVTEPAGRQRPRRLETATAVAENRTRQIAREG